ncbi:hypothetical protein BSL82_12730 [Tardibacter chloracetimidivorans]|uniref:EF-hand domain-containing protein n=1 Tax=Tardibacter chloracetimidivorans TaxID=1921510 RepID=A0A1L3ZWQ2_9SPHN|nr:EF-hand domain-containing protein [Tardibacter chloracetimidivorans]API60062.1 hypothetical protein BSL82_12730 [Tardibacter chloracetimidivorans]
MTRTLLSASALALMIAAPVHAQEVPADPTMPPATADPTSPGAPMPQDPPTMPADPAMPAPEAAPAGPAAPGESALPADPATPAGPAMPAPEATPPTTGEAMPPAASPEASAPGMSPEAAQTPADWATFDKDSKGYLTPLEFGTWVMAKQGNDMSAEVEKTKSSKRANIPAVKVLNATGTMFLKADTNGDRRITPDELASAVAG